MRSKVKPIVIFPLLLCILFVAGCGNSQTPDYEQLSPYTTTVDAIAYPAQGIVALGEATHGNREFAALKQELFQQLVTQNNVRAFALEGDFGGCRVVNTYIQTGEGSAEQAAGAIGFTIYKTQEMVDMLEWMREFNEGREPADKIRFYGYDMQRYDNNKAGLFEILQASAPALGGRYGSLLSAITDETMYGMDNASVDQLLAELDSLYTELELHKDTIVSATSAAEFDLALEFAKAIGENTQLRTASNYGTLRDAFMAERVQWIYRHEKEYYNSPLIFVAGHNSHIGKTNATVGVEKCMGQILHEWYGPEYFAIGTEFNASTFLAPDASSGERTEFTVQNSGDTRLAVLLVESDINPVYLDIAEATTNAQLAAYLESKQPMSAIGESFAESYAR